MNVTTFEKQFIDVLTCQLNSTLKQVDTRKADTKMTMKKVKKKVKESTKKLN